MPLFRVGQQVADRQVQHCAAADAEKEAEDRLGQTLKENHPAMAELSSANR